MLKKKYFIAFLFYFIACSLFSQNDSIKVDSKYWEDQLYFGINYNIFKNQPSTVEPSEVSYSFSLGYIKDIPLNSKGTTAFGIGVGYSYDYFSHNLVLDNTSFYTDSDSNRDSSFDKDVTNNKLKTYNIEVPIQFRIRTSDPVTYSFWRVYFGVRLSYNFFHKFQYTYEDEDLEFTGLNAYNKFQTGIELSAGYGAFNFYAYYGLTPIFKNAMIGDEEIKTSVLKLGLIFYLL